MGGFLRGLRNTLIEFARALLNLLLVFRRHEEAFAALTESSHRSYTNATVGARRR
jgi:hypothetical protein